VADPRRGDLEDDGEEEDEAQEIDETIGEAPGTVALLAQTPEEATNDDAVLDYIVEYTRAHLSPVLARGLRLYRQRGLSALSEELKITKAPRKTLARVLEFASVRFRKAALIYDDFGNWLEIPVDLRSQVVASMTSLRWSLAGSAVMVLMLAPEEAPELEETFSGGAQVKWGFDNLPALQDNPTDLVDDMVNEWLASAALPGASPMTMADPGLRRVAEAADLSLPRFLALGREAIEDAAARHASCIDDEAIAAAIARVAG